MKIMLTKEDMELLVETLNNPPQPNEKMKEAFESYYRERVKRVGILTNEAVLRSANIDEIAEANRNDLPSH